MATGIHVSDEAVTSFEELKFTRQYRYIIFRLSDDLQEVITEHKGLSTATWDEMVLRLPNDGCRYVYFGLHYLNQEGHQRSKLISILWTPTTASTKEKFTVSCTHEAVRKSFLGIGHSLQAGNKCELDLEAVVEQVRNKI